MTMDEPVVLQLPELFRQGAFRYFSDLATKLSESSNITFSNIPEKLNLIFSTQ
jgi:hypothetical protein